MNWKNYFVLFLVLLLPAVGLADDDEAEEICRLLKIEQHVQERFQDIRKEQSFMLESYWMEDGDNGMMIAVYPFQDRFFLSILTYEDGKLIEDVTSDRALFQEPVVQTALEVENELNLFFASGAGMVWTQGLDGLWRLTWYDVPQEDGTVLEVPLEEERGTDAAHLDAGSLPRTREALDACMHVHTMKNWDWKRSRFFCCPENTGECCRRIQ